jgi:hypothetical protein
VRSRGAGRTNFGAKICTPGCCGAHLWAARAGNTGRQFEVLPQFAPSPGQGDAARGRPQGRFALLRNGLRPGLILVANSLPRRPRAAKWGLGGPKDPLFSHIPDGSRGNIERTSNSPPVSSLTATARRAQGMSGWGEETAFSAEPGNNDAKGGLGRHGYGAAASLGRLRASAVRSARQWPLGARR